MEYCLLRLPSMNTTHTQVAMHVIIIIKAPSIIRPNLSFTDQPFFPISSSLAGRSIQRTSALDSLFPHPYRRILELVEPHRSWSDPSCSDAHLWEILHFLVSRPKPLFLPSGGCFRGLSNPFSWPNRTRPQRWLSMITTKHRIELYLDRTYCQTHI